MTETPASASPALAVRGLRKRFGSVQALDGVDLDFWPGEIHAVLGENGAGKSTLMHVLSGVLRPDSGTLLLDGVPVSLPSARAARRAGIGMVFQHFTLVEPLTVAENLALSCGDQGRWRLDLAAVVQQAQALARHVGLALSPPDAVVGHLPVGARQRLEILKALASGTRAVILDEPTAVLTPSEVGQLFAMLRQLRAQQRTLLFITHKLREVKDVADRVTIMRRGRVVSTHPIAEISEAEMAERMIGEMAPAHTAAPRATPSAEAAVTVTALNAAGHGGDVGLRAVSCSVGAGEILGIAGVDGNGQRELFEVLVGLRRPAAGTIRVGEHTLDTFTPRAALAAGISHIPPDRHTEGLVLPMTVAENFLLNRRLLDRFSRRSFLQHAAARDFARALAERYAIRYAGLDEPVRSLSGGNQQRVVVARQLADQPLVLVAVNPTRGLDVAATRAVADALRDVARAGCAVVLISTDLDEVLDLSDRVAVLSRGHLSAPLVPPLDPERLGLLMAGAAA